MNKPKLVRIKGIVIKGSGEGTKIGIPTANIATDDNVSELEQGVYATNVFIDGKTYGGVAHYGPRAVFNEFHPQLEVHIFKLKEMIYGKTIEIELLEFIRPTLKFSTIDEMLKTINIDISSAKQILTTL